MELYRAGPSGRDMGDGEAGREGRDTVRLQFEDGSVRAAVAEGFLERLRGLRFRHSGAMLFRFDSPTRATVDTLLVPEELHLYFFDADRRLADRATLAPYRLYRPSESYQYLLESFEPLGVGDDARLPVPDR